MNNLKAVKYSTSPSEVQVCNSRVAKKKKSVCLTEQWKYSRELKGFY